MEQIAAELEFRIYEFDGEDEIAEAGTTANGVLKIKPIDQGLKMLLRRMYQNAGPKASCGDTDRTRMIGVPATVSETGLLTLRFSLSGHALGPVERGKKRRRRR